MIRVEEIRGKATRRGGIATPGAVLENAHAEVSPGVQIRIFGSRPTIPGQPLRTYDRTFKVGDLAEYHSYNLSYYGRIVSIAAATVTIAEDGCGRTRNRRLDLCEFSWRNWDFDASEASRKNSDTMQYI